MGIKSIGKRKFRLASGEVVEREAGIAGFEIEGKGRRGSDVIFWRKGRCRSFGFIDFRSNGFKS